MQGNFMYKPRHIEQLLRSISAYSKVILITGARQVGKSTLLANSFPDLQTFLFDSGNDRFNAKSDPDFFLKTNQPPIILDEIQYVPQLLSSIKRFVDQSPQRPQYFLTGSQNLAMLSTVAESMAGRVTILPLGPMTVYEQAGRGLATSWLHHYLHSPHTLRSHIKGALGAQTLISTIWRGGMPGYANIPDEFLHREMASYVETYINRDVRDMGEAGNVEDFTNFFSIMAVKTGQEINFDELGRELAIPGKKAKNWLALLSQGYQWRSIPPYHGNTEKRITHKRKGYIPDTGLACYLQHIPSPLALQGHPLRGALFETLMVNTIQALLDTMPFSAQLYHWRTNGGAEVDLVISLNGKLYPIEMKMSTQLSKHDTRGLRALRETYDNVMPGIILYAGSDCYPIDEHTLALPWDAVVVE